MRFDLIDPAQLTLALLPDLIVMGGAMLVLLFAVWRRESVSHFKAVGWASVVVCLAATAAVFWYWIEGAVAVLPGVIAVDPFRWAASVLILLSAVIAILLSMDYAEREGLVVAEAHVLVLLAAAGMMLLVAARDLILVFLGIELMSISTYVLAGLNRRSARAAEASLKYFLLGAFSTGFLLYGIALTYGATGSTDLAVIGTRVLGEGWLGSPMLLVGLALLVVGFGFKVGAAPFHMWTPDVYEGAPTPFTAYMAAGVKIAAFAAFLRVWMEAFPAAIEAWFAPIAAIAVITMVVGNIVALAQKNMKRLLAYSSIAHAGYLLVAVLAASQAAASAFLFYLLAYTLATMGAFAVVVALGEAGERNQAVADFAGLWTARPWLAVAMAVFMLALLGFPIAGGMGFFAKWYLLQAALTAPVPRVSLAVVLVLASVISAGYYLYVIMVMFMRPRPEGAAPLRATPVATGVVIAVATAALLFFGIFPGPVVRLVNASYPAPVSHAPPVVPIAATHAR